MAAIHDGTPTSTFRLSQEANGLSFDGAKAFGSGSSSSAPKQSGFWQKKPKPVPKDYDGMTPEDVHEIRYAGIKMELAAEDLGPTKDVSNATDPAHFALAQFRNANEAAARALEKHKILLPHEIRQKLDEPTKKFDDLGSEVFVVMHMLPAFLSSRDDHAPIELTIVRVRLATGVEKDVCHLFPSPLPMPFGKLADFKAARQEFHEIDEVNFKHFSNDYVWMFHKIVSTLHPRWPGKGRPPKIPLIVCKDYQVQNIIRMFEYIHERALSAQQGSFETAAPRDFIVPESLSIPFCTLDGFKQAMRMLLRECRFVKESQMLEELDMGKINHCPYHQTTNKVTCTTYCVSEMVEQMLTFSHFWSNEIPARFVEPYTLMNYIERAGADLISSSSSTTPPASDSTHEILNPKVKFSNFKSMQGWNVRTKTFDVEDVEVDDMDRASIYSESCDDLGSRSGPRTMSLGRASDSMKTSSHSEATASSSERNVVIQSNALGRGDGAAESQENEMDLPSTASSDQDPATPSPTPMIAVSECGSDDFDMENAGRSQGKTKGPSVEKTVPRESFRRLLRRQL